MRLHAAKKRKLAAAKKKFPVLFSFLQVSLSPQGVAGNYDLYDAHTGRHGACAYRQYRVVIQSVRQPANQSVSQPVTVPGSQSVGPSMSQSTCHMQHDRKDYVAE